MGLHNDLSKAMEVDVNNKEVLRELDNMKNYLKLSSYGQRSMEDDYG